jgi:outer membrane protein insertion porin family
MKFKTLVVALSCFGTPYFAQVTVPQTSDNNTNQPTKPGVYFLKDFQVGGQSKFTPEQILRFTGLSLGESIEIPGLKISGAVKKLWETNLFSAVEVFTTSINEQQIGLRFDLKGLKEIADVKIEGGGIGKSTAEKIAKDNKLKPGVKITENLISNLKHNIPLEYIGKGYADAKINVYQSTNVKDSAQSDLRIVLDKGEKIKINKIAFEGNNSFSPRKLRGTFNDTREKLFIWDWIYSSKLINEKYDADKKSLISFYQSQGFRDAKIVKDSIWRNEAGYNILIKLSEGKKYYIKDISFTGNTTYSSEFLSRVLGYKRGDIYDAVGFNKKVGDDGGKEDDSDIKSIYQNAGFLFSNVTPVEKSIENDSINLEIRIKEGQKATWNKVTFSGNTVTHDHVIQRALRTRPGHLFSKSDIKRTYFDLAGMPYIDGQQIAQDLQPNPVDNTVDMHWKVGEKSGSQVNLQAGYGGNSFIGTLGLTLNNFSLKNFLKMKDFKPFPQGDGQTLALQFQKSLYFTNYSLQFTEPWIFGTRPTALSVGFNNSGINYPGMNGAPEQKLNIFSVNAGLNRLLNWPDNYFSLYTGVQYQRYSFNNYPFQFGNQSLNNGASNNFAFNIGLSRNSAGPDPIFKETGTDMELSTKFTLPYSLFSNKDYSTLSPDEKFRWMEFYKIKFKADSYNQLVGKLVLRSSMELGYLNAYNSKLGPPPFERYYVGGTGLMNGRMDGRELVPLRGYENSSSTGGTNADITPLYGATIYNRFAMELRYPISMTQTAKIFALAFAEGGNAWNNYQSYNPFQLKRSVGVGVRVFMGAFGLIGFDFAYGFDNPTTYGNPSGWKTHFLMNQNL